MKRHFYRFCRWKFAQVPNGYQNVIQLYINTLIGNSMQQEDPKQFSGKETTPYMDKTTAQKVFDLGDFVCKYHNITTTRRIEGTEYEYIRESPIEILNRLPRLEGNCLVRQIQVISPLIVLRFEDSFRYELKRQKSDSGANDRPSKNLLHHVDIRTESKPREINRQKQLMKRRKLNEIEDLTDVKRNTKNIVGNFIKAFRKYLKSSKKSDKMWERVFCRSTKINNKLILKIIEEKQMGILFFDFLENRAQQWIDQSQVQNKDLHKQAMQVYVEKYNDFQKQEKGQSGTNDSSDKQESSRKNISFERSQRLSDIQNSHSQSGEMPIPMNSNECLSNYQ